MGPLSPLFYNPISDALMFRESSDRWLSHNSKLFSLGSCFAINFNRWFNIHAARPERAGLEYYFNAPSVIRALRFAVGGELAEHSGWIVEEGGKERVVDGFNHTLSAPDASQLREMQSELRKSQRMAFNESDVIIVTLGLSVVWEEFIEGDWVVLNSSPPKSYWGNRAFRVRNQTSSEVCEAVIEMAEILSRAQSKKKFVLSISPIPLKASFTGNDAKTETLYSKAALISGVREAMTEIGKQLAYFPAFEIFWLTGNPQTKFQSDGRHLKSIEVQKICREFVEMFSTDSDRYPILDDFRVPTV